MLYTLENFVNATDLVQRTHYRSFYRWIVASEPILV